MQNSGAQTSAMGLKVAAIAIENLIDEMEKGLERKGGDIDPNLAEAIRDGAGVLRHIAEQLTEAYTAARVHVFAHALANAGSLDELRKLWEMNNDNDTDGEDGEQQPAPGGENVLPFGKRH